MGIIEEATRRLEQLEKAGVAVPWEAAHPVRAGAGSAPAPARPRRSSGASDAALVDPARPDPSGRLTIDLDALGAEGYVVPAQVRSRTAAEFRDVKRALLKNARAQGEASNLRGTLVAVTSAVPGEGKTFCAINLAMSMAMEVDTAVILVDADVVRPTVLTRLGAPGHPVGLLDLLVRDDLPLHEALISTNVPKLTVMASGSRNERSPELLGSNAMGRLLDRLAAEYADHVVIFDAPPLLLASEASILASAVGQVVMVVEASRTPSHLVSKAFAAVKNCPVVLSVLNKGVERAAEQRYGDYYG
ncbi:MAG: AAA family ATPase [Caldimonas sp.]